jgi:hypothetical protein
MRVTVAMPSPLDDQDVQYADALMNAPRFERLVGRTIDRILREWEIEQDPRLREAAWWKVEGLRLLQRELQATTEHGLMAQAVNKPLS